MSRRTGGRAHVRGNEVPSIATTRRGLAVLGDGTHEPERGGEADATPAQAEMLENRLRKNLRHLTKWARREQVTCFRLYDADIPEVPLAIDRYGDHAQVALYVGKDPRSPAWMAAMVEVVARVLGIASANVHIKDRAPQRVEGHDDQYEKRDARGERLVVNESGLRFFVNLTDYLDTGLFLDHRPMRAMVRADAANKTVLNLFAYTGAFTVYAVAGGARASTTIDMSATYLAWAADNMRLNGIACGPGTPHELVRADVLAWLDEPAQPRFDLAIVDPPTFSTSKRMRGTWDVQRDHAWLLARVAAHVRPGGSVYFSTNARRFKPVPEAFAEFGRVEDISSASIPPDFRDPKIHRAWKMTKRSAA